MARSFNGSTTHILPTNIALVGTDFSLACWVYPLATGNQVCIGRTEGVPAHHNYYLQVEATSRWLGGFYDSTGATWRGIRSGTGFSTGAWHHIAYTWDHTAKVARLYHAGSQIATDTFANATPNNAGTLYFGVGDGGTDNRFNGRLAECCIYSRLLSAGEIVVLMRGGPPCIGAVGIQGYWPLWGVASPEPDLSGLSRNGVVTDATPADHAPVGRYAPMPVPAMTRAPDAVFPVPARMRLIARGPTIGGAVRRPAPAAFRLTTRDPVVRTIGPWEKPTLPVAAWEKPTLPVAALAKAAVDAPAWSKPVSKPPIRLRPLPARMRLRAVGPRQELNPAHARMVLRALTPIVSVGMSEATAYVASSFATVIAIRTLDYGQAWATVPFVGALYTYDRQRELWICGNTDRKLYASKNGGATILGPFGEAAPLVPNGLVRTATGVFVATTADNTYGVLRSTGGSWATIAAPLARKFTLHYNPVLDQLLYLSGSSAMGSSDGGQSWGQWFQNPVPWQTFNDSVFVTRAGTWLISTSNQTDPNRSYIYRSVNGTTWAEVLFVAAKTGDVNFPKEALLCQRPSDGKIRFVSRWVSTNDGQTWVDSGQDMLGHTAYANAGEILLRGIGPFIGPLSYVERSVNGGDTWDGGTSPAITGLVDIIATVRAFEGN